MSMNPRRLALAALLGGALALPAAFALPARAEADGGDPQAAAAQDGRLLAQRERHEERGRTEQRSRSRERVQQRAPRASPSGRAHAPPRPSHTGMPPNVPRAGMPAHPRYDWHGYQPGRRLPDRAEHRRADRRVWERNWVAPQRFHWRAYHYPSGWSYRRWSYGMILPLAFWSREYWIPGYWDFGLPNPPYGYVWVRYGNDALLVAVTNGLILQAWYNLFY